MLATLANEMESLGIPYEYWEWTGAVSYPYWVGEYIEEESMTEDGQESCSLILTGFARGSFSELEQQKELMKDHFWNGVTIVSDGKAVAIYYGDAFPIPVDEMDLKKIQVNLKAKKWKVR